MLQEHVYIVSFLTESAQHKITQKREIIREGTPRALKRVGGFLLLFTIKK
jgi:hypothetical protein